MREWNERRIEAFKKHWNAITKEERRKINGAFNARPWTIDYHIRWSFPCEISAMRAAGLFVHFHGITSEGDWGVEITNTNELLPEIISLIENVDEEVNILMTDIYLTDDNIVGDVSNDVVTGMLLHRMRSGFFPGALVSLSLQDVDDTNTSLMIYLDEDMMRKTIKYFENVLLEHNDKKDQDTKK